MSKLAEALREKKIFNNWMLLGMFGTSDDDVAVDYYPPPPRSVRPSVTRVWTPNRSKKLKHSTDFGRRTYEKQFYGYKKESWPQALEWVKENLKTELVPSPFGGYISKRILDKAKELIQ